MCKQIGEEILKLSLSIHKIVFLSRRRYFNQDDISPAIDVYLIFYFITNTRSHTQKSNFFSIK